jgi:hypothetical protein
VPFSGSRETLVEVYDALGEDELALRDQLRREGEFAEAQELRLSGLQSSVAGDLEAALREFDRALEIDPADPNLHNDRGAVLAAWSVMGKPRPLFAGQRSSRPKIQWSRKTSRASTSAPGTKNFGTPRSLGGRSSRGVRRRRPSEIAGIQLGALGTLRAIHPDS